MNKKVAYKIAEWTSGIALIITLVYVVWNLEVFVEGWAALILPFIVLPWVIFIVGLFVTEKWAVTEKWIMWILILASIWFFVMGLYYVIDTKIFDPMSAFLILVSLIIGIESIAILKSD